ncbi:hypothetical protein NWF24_19150 [Variovorax paradoxus]|uniref:hypothetical protein n=1 Tax=Variovorax paradoxus TaxID=34073 RepID=UPI0021AC5BD4|nr:hypothetical protein [Variovorax paradoxus]UVH54958.1 hypothetical protein NWF24_19150 [Variovorax paradoxus]
MRQGFRGFARNVSDAQAPVVPGHYRPVDRPLTNIEQLAEHHGVAHLVLLQPSVYDYDNTVMLEALRQGNGRHRGVAVLESGTTDAQWHRCIPAACEACDSTLYRRLAMTGTSTRTFMHSPPRIQPVGWHVQWYARPEHWSRIADLGLRLAAHELRA